MAVRRSGYFLLSLNLRISTGFDLGADFFAALLIEQQIEALARAQGIAGGRIWGHT